MESRALEAYPIQRGEPNAKHKNFEDHFWCSGAYPECVQSVDKRFYLPEHHVILFGIVNERTRR